MWEGAETYEEKPKALSVDSADLTFALLTYISKFSDTERNVESGQEFGRRHWVICL